jgi:hypothetical protein
MFNSVAKERDSLIVTQSQVLQFYRQYPQYPYGAMGQNYSAAFLTKGVDGKYYVILSEINYEGAGGMHLSLFDLFDPREMDTNFCLAAPKRAF